MKFSPVRLLILLTVLLAGGLAWMWIDEHAQLRNLAWIAPKPLSPDIKALPNASSAGAAASNPTAYIAILERPVFAPDRRPPPPPAPPAPPDPMANIEIRGIFSGVNAGIIASVDGKVRRVKVNEAVGSWTLKSIEGRDVTFTQGGENRQLRLAYAPLGPRNPQAAPPQVQISAGTAPAPTSTVTAPSPQDETRAYLRRRNEALISRGLPPVAE